MPPPDEGGRPTIEAEKVLEEDTLLSPCRFGETEREDTCCSKS